MLEKNEGKGKKGKKNREVSKKIKKEEKINIMLDNSQHYVLFGLWKIAKSG